MSLGFREQKQAARRRWRFLKLLIFMAFLGGMGMLAYQTGTVLAQREATRLRLEVDRLSTDLTATRGDNVKLRQETQAAKAAEAEWRQRYESAVPTPEVGDLLALIREQIKKGADAERIRFLVGTAANERSCDGQPVSKRFLVRTPLYQGANDAVTFGDNAITVTAEGESATNADGNPEAWYDVAKPVKIRFIELGGKATEASGMLPLQHSVVRGDREYRFSIVAAERRGFVTVTGDSCAFP